MTLIPSSDPKEVLLFSTMPIFEYSPLDQGPFSTRILRLLPSKDRAAPIECQLSNLSLRDDIAQEYDALSYVWGDEADGQCNISINNQALSVGKNLHSALLRLRGHRVERTLWVDAICIDQNNVGEKEKQIQNMARIYEQASQVIVWLGEEADDSTQALEAIRVAAESVYSGEDSNPPSGSVPIEGIKSLFLRGWFYRMWVSNFTLCPPSSPSSCSSRSDIRCLRRGSRSSKRWASLGIFRFCVVLSE